MERHQEIGDEEKQQHSFQNTSLPINEDERSCFFIIAIFEDKDRCNDLQRTF